MIKQLEETILDVLEERPGISKELLFNLVIGEIGNKYGVVKLDDYKIALHNLDDKIEEKEMCLLDLFHEEYNHSGIYLKKEQKE